MPSFVVLLIFLYVVLPLVILLTQKAKIHPEIKAIPPETLPREWQDFLDHHLQELRALGFLESSYLQIAAPLPGATATTVMMVNRHTGDKAMVNVLFSKSGGSTIKTLYLEFNTRLADGRCFNTNNSKQLGSFVLPATDTNTYLPSVKSPHELYQAHRMVLRESNAQGERVLYPPGTAAAYLAEVWTKGFDEQVELGQYRRNDKAGIFQLTLLGAYRMTWMLLWPISTIRLLLRWLNEQKVRSRLRASEQEPIASFFPPQAQQVLAGHFEL